MQKLFEFFTPAVLIVMLVTHYWPRARRWRLLAFTMGGVAIGFMATDMAVITGFYLPKQPFGSAKPVSVYALSPVDAVKVAAAKTALANIRRDQCDNSSPICLPSSTKTLLNRIEAAQDIDTALGVLADARGGDMPHVQ